MEVTTHGNLLYFHVYFAQQVIGCYLFISIAQ
jgi:enoyl reductase-like protein